ncbi:MAG: sulfite oxidase-like oxidoreductase [Betaproteobacteria bacterium]|nr:sulfite oxidase-like oxidoreductase [Betaproteobacteria bacterium]
MPDWEKLIEGKIALAKRGTKPSKVNSNERIPTGQTEVKNFPILDLGIRPQVTTQNWNLHVYGLVKTELAIDWESFLAMPQVTDISDFHCVTRWSQLDMDWQGVRASEILAMVQPKESANFATLYGYDGYSTNLPLEALLDDDVIIAHSVLGKPLSLEHGGPVRIVVPKRYAWKGAKWLKAIELHEFDRPGFWEVRGYHNEGDPWLEQRFSDD